MPRHTRPVLSRRVEALGRFAMKEVLRLDLGVWIGVRAGPDTEIVSEWIDLAVRNFFAGVAWLLLWPFFHRGMIALVVAALREPSIDPRFSIPVEVLPSALLTVSLLRCFGSIAQITTVGRAVGAARRAGTAPPAWTQRDGVRLRIATPTDVDFVVIGVLVALLELLLPR